MEKRGIVLLAERRAKQWINSSHKPNATDVVEALKKDGPCQCLTQNASVWNARKKNEKTHSIKRQFKEKEKNCYVGTLTILV